MTETTRPDNELRDIRLQKVEALRKHGINPYPYNFKRTTNAAEIQEKYKDLAPDEVTSDRVSLAGRIQSIRNSGMFIDILDEAGNMQLFTSMKEVGEDLKGLIDHLDLGDWIGLTGIVRRTKRGELTVNIETLELLSKTLLPPPEKYHGLTDVETKYRQRYMDLIANEESRNRLRQRSQIIAATRAFLIEKGFLEVETPMLHTIPGGAAAKPFMTHHNALNMTMYLRIAPELFLKRLIVGGLSDKVFEINRNFRNEGISPRHNPEFTMLELYQAYADYRDMMRLTEDLFQYVAQRVFGTLKIAYGEKELDFSSPWCQKSMLQLVEEATGVNFDEFKTAKEAALAAKKLGIFVKDSDSWGKVVETVFGEKVEQTLTQPTHVTDLPLDISPLAKAHRTNPRLTERFETYINCWEVANAFSELTDPIDQRARFEAQVQNRESGDDEAHHMDHDFITALEYGLPPTGGLGIGIDRMVMLLTNAPSIRDVISFPTMKPKD
jgi:lysyl-tRNA synthetase class 2